MSRSLSSLLFTVVFTACSSQSETLSVKWEIAQRLPGQSAESHLGVAGPLVGIVGDKLLIAAGANFPEGMPWDGGKKIYQHKAYLYTIDDEELVLDREFAFSDSIAYAANISVDGFIYSAGGEGENGATSAVVKYGLDTNGDLQKQILKPLPEPLTNGALIFAHGSLYFVGGENAIHVSDKVYKLDLTVEEGQWEEFLILPYPVTHAVVVYNSADKILIAGGRKRNDQAKSDIYDAVLEIDINTRTINKLSSLPQPLAAGTGVWEEGHLIIIGGDDASTFHRVEQLIADIGRMENGEQRSAAIAQKNELQRQHPGFVKAVWAFDTEGKKWTRLDDLVGESPVTTTAVQYRDRIIIPSGEIKAGVRTDQILWAKIEKQ